MWGYWCRRFGGLYRGKGCVVRTDWRSKIERHVEQGQGIAGVSWRLECWENATLRRWAAQHAHEGQLINDSLLLRRLQDLTETKYHAGNAEQHQGKEDDHTPEQDARRRR